MKKPKDILGPKKEFNSSTLKQKKSVLDPTKKKSFQLYNDDVRKSQRALNLSFTNFLDKSSAKEFEEHIHQYVGSWDKLHEQDIELGMDNVDRLRGIFNLYLNSDYHVDQVAKILLMIRRPPRSTPLRIYVWLHESVYYVFLIDPLHLVIPSRVQREGNIFQKSKGNGYCMSRVFETIKNNR